MSDLPFGVVFFTSTLQPALMAFCVNTANFFSLQLALKFAKKRKGQPWFSQWSRAHFSPNGNDESSERTLLRNFLQSKNSSICHPSDSGHDHNGTLQLLQQKLSFFPSWPPFCPDLFLDRIRPIVVWWMTELGHAMMDQKTWISSSTPICFELQLFCTTLFCYLLHDGRCLYLSFLACNSLLPNNSALCTSVYKMNAASASERRLKKYAWWRWIKVSDAWNSFRTIRSNKSVLANFYGVGKSGIGGHAQYLNSLRTWLGTQDDWNPRCRSHLSIKNEDIKSRIVLRAIY